MNNAPPNPNNPNQSPVFPPPQRKSPQQIARVIGDHIRAAVTVLAWGILGAVALATSYVAFRAILWAVRLITHALGGV